VGGWSPIGSTRHCGHQWPIVPVPADYDDGEIGGMIGRGNRSNGRKPSPVPLCPPQTPHTARTRTRAAAVGSQRLFIYIRRKFISEEEDLEYLSGQATVWTAGDRFPEGAKDSSLCHNTQAAFWAHPASCPIGTGGSFAGGKAAGS
jgi:hypothetical protein